MAEREAVDAQELVREVESLREQRRAVHDVLRQVTRSEGLQPVLDEIVNATMRLCRGGDVELFLAQGDLFYIQAYTEGVLEDHVEYDRDNPHGRDRTTVVGRVALTGETVQIPDLLDDPEYSYGGQQIYQYRALLGVPILLDGELIGVIGVGRTTPGLFADDEVELVSTFADQAAIAIANSRLLEAVERQRTELARFLSPQVAELISSEQGEQLLAGHRAYITCVFCDLRGFTSFAETAAPEDLFEVLREYHAALGQLIPEYGGTLEHFAGDGVMVFFNDPVPVVDHELQAVRFALAAQERLAELGRTWRKWGVTLELGVGMEAGHATLGRIGFEGRYDYGVLGPVTPLAFRLSIAAEGRQILIGQRVFGAVDDVVDAVPVGELELKGFGRPIAAYDVRGLRG
jgi:class 3 adenylate cyclase